METPDSADEEKDTVTEKEALSNNSAEVKMEGLIID